MARRGSWLLAVGEEEAAAEAPRPVAGDAERHEAADEEEADLLHLGEPEPGERQRHEDDDRHIRADERERPEEGRDGREAAHVDAERHGDHGGEAEADRDPDERRRRAAHESLLEVEPREGLQHLERARQDEGRKHAVLYARAVREQPPAAEYDGDEGRREEEPDGPRGFRSDAQVEESHGGGDEPDESECREEEAQLRAGIRRQSAPPPGDAGAPGWAPARRAGSHSPRSPPRAGSCPSGRSPGRSASRSPRSRCTTGPGASPPPRA